MTQKTVRRKVAKLPRKQHEYPQIEGDEAAQFLHASGMLFAINKAVMHPVGLVLTLKDGLTPVIIDRRQNPTCRFTDREFKAGMEKVKSFLEDQGGADVQARRKKLLGYLIQQSGDD